MTWIVVALVIVPVVALSVYGVMELLRRSDVAGGRKAAWIAGVVFLPLVGGAAYLVFRPSRPEDIHGFGRRNRQEQQVRQLLPDDDADAPD